MGGCLLIDAIETRVPAMKSPKSNTPRLLYSRRDAAEILGISIRAIDYLIATQQLATRTIGSRRLIPRWTLDQYARRDHPGPIAPPESRNAASGASSQPEHSDANTPDHGEDDSDRDVDAL
jgi:hypothetical protein